MLFELPRHAHADLEVRDGRTALLERRPAQGALELAEADRGRQLKALGLGPHALLRCLLQDLVPSPFSIERGKIEARHVVHTGFRVVWNCRRGLGSS